MAIPLETPDEDAEVTLRFGRPFMERIAGLVSLATTIGLLAFVSGRGSLPRVAWPRWRERLNTWWEAEECPPIEEQ